MYMPFECFECLLEETGIYFPVNELPVTTYDFARDGAAFRKHDVMFSSVFEMTKNLIRSTDQIDVRILCVFVHCLRRR